MNDGLMYEITTRIGWLFHAHYDLILLFSISRLYGNWLTHGMMT